MVALPARTPVTIPETVPTVATPGLLLLHVPPGVVIPKVIDDPAHTTGVPLMAAGFGLTVIGVKILHPVGSV